jgi:hypothetical protein
MKKNLIYFVLFLVSILMFGTFVSAQQKTILDVDHVYYIDKDGKNEAPDSFKIIITGRTSIDFLDGTTNISRHIDVVSLKDSDDFLTEEGDSFMFYEYYARLDSAEPVIFGVMRDNEHKLYSIGLDNERKQYTIVFLLRNRKPLKGIKN